MSRLRILYSRLRAEEKMLFAAAEARGIPCSLEDIRTSPWRIEPNESDLFLARCIVGFWTVYWKLVSISTLCFEK